jgi:hypothetical protein
VAVTLHASGTHTAGVAAEATLATAAVVGTFTYHVDLTALAAGDVVILRVYQKVLTGGTQRVLYVQRYSGVQPTDDAVKVSLPASNDLVESNALTFTIHRTHGAAASLPWKVLKYA